MENKSKKRKVTLFLDTETLDRLESIANKLGSGSKSLAVRFLAKEHENKKQKE